MNLEDILRLLGASNADDAAKSITRFNSFLATLQAATGKQNREELLATLATSHELASAVRQLTGTDSVPGTMGVIEGWKASAERVHTLEAQAKAAEAAATERQAKDLIEQATRDGRLLEASRRQKAEDFGAKYGLDGLRDYLDGLPRAVAPSTGRVAQPNPHQSNGEGPVQLTDEERYVARVMGKSETWMIEAKQLWHESSKSSGGRIAAITESHTMELNRSAVRAHAIAGLTPVRSLPPSNLSPAAA